MRPLPDIRVSNVALLEYREQRGLTQEALAKKLSEKCGCNVANSAISHWENGSRYVPMKYIDPLCEILSTSISELTVQPQGKADASLFDVPSSMLSTYDKKPVWVHFDKYEKKDNWALVRVNSTDIELIFTDSVVKVTPRTEGLSYSSKEPIHNLPEGVLGKCMSLTEMKKELNVYVTLTTADVEMRALYNGWYTHNSTKTSLINSDGMVLPYSGLGKSYTAHKEKLIKD